MDKFTTAVSLAREGELARAKELFLGLTGWFYRADFEAIPEEYLNAF